MQNKIEHIFFSNGYRGGASTFINDHINHLIKKRKNVSLIDNHPNKTYDQLNKKIRLYKNTGDIKKIDKILNSGNSKKFLFITNYAFIIKYYFILKKFKQKNNKIILTLHSGLLELTLKNYLAGLLFSLIYKNIDFLFFGSYSAKEWWHKKYPWMKIKNLPVFYNGAKCQKIKKKKNLSKKIIVTFAGRLENENNPIFFLDIANQILKTKKNIFFNIYGDGTLLSDLKKKYKKRNITFHGWVKKKIIFKKTNLFMITSPVNNYPYVALEAKSHGIPVISCSKGDINKIIKNGIDGFIKHTDSVETMIALINKVFRDYQYFSHNSYLRSYKFDINTSCEKFWRKIKIENNNLR